MSREGIAEKPGTYLVFLACVLSMTRAPTTKRARQRKYNKKSKNDRLNPKGWMDGKREGVFLPLVPSFAEAADKGWQALEDRLMELQNLYHFHFPWPMKDTDEPEVLREYDPLRPERPTEVELSDEQLAEKRTHVALYNRVSDSRLNLDGEAHILGSDCVVGYTTGLANSGSASDG